MSENTGKMTDRQAINEWMDRINEHDPALRNEVLENCKNDEEVRAFYVSKAKEFLKGE